MISKTVPPFAKILGRLSRLAHPQSVLGYIERIEPTAIQGWALDRRRRPLRLEVRIKQQHYALTPIWKERADVANAHGEAFLYAGFHCETSAELAKALKTAMQSAYPIAVLANGVALSSIKYLELLAPSLASQTFGSEPLQSGKTGFSDDLLALFDDDSFDSNSFDRNAPTSALDLDTQTDTDPVTDAAVMTHAKRIAASSEDENRTDAPQATAADLDRFVALLRKQCALGRYAKVLAILDDPRCARYFPAPCLELALLRTLAQIAQRQWQAIDGEQFIAAFLDDFHQPPPPEMRTGHRERIHTILRDLSRDPTAGLAVADIADDAIHGMLSCLALPLAQWTYRLTQDAHLAQEFVDLLLPDAHPDARAQRLFLIQLNRGTGRNAKALSLIAEHLREQTDTWFAWHELGVLLRFSIRNDPGYAQASVVRAIDAFVRASVLNPMQSLSQREGWGLLGEFFDQAMATSSQLAESGDLPEALAQRQQDLALLAKLSQTLQNACRHPLDAKSHRWSTLNARKILLCGSRELYQCFYYRVREKIDQAAGLGLEADFLDLSELPFTDWRQRLMGAVALYACRIPACMTEIKLMVYARSLGIPLIYDIDDLIFDAKLFPPPLKTYAGTIDADQHLHLKLDNPLFGVAIGLADHCSVSTRPLANEVARYLSGDAGVTVLPNLLSQDVFALAKYAKPARAKNAKTIRLFYGSATKAHKQAFYDLFLPAAIEILKRYPQVELHLVGYFDQLPAVLRDAGRIQLIDPTSDYLAYLDLVAQADINIAVLESSRVTDVKSEIKWLEAAAFGIPSVVSPTAAYRQALADGKTALFAATVSEWQQQIARLIKDPELRASIGQSARALALKNFSPAVGERIFDDILKPYWCKSPAGRTKKRVLLVNVYFYPQSQGGATRVMETQVRGLLEYYAEEYEIFILTTQADSDPEHPYRIDQYWYHAALVTRIEVPPRDWATYQDSRIQTICEDLIRTYDFDLIHLHSIQMLTASVALAALARRTPYLVTLHDAWWISRYLFLVDELGQLVDHTDPLSGGAPPPKGESIGNRLARSRMLKQVLEKAAAVLAVSDKFAALYREAGIANVLTHENIPESFTPSLPTPRNDERIVLGFIGGLSRHKGYHLLREAIMTGDFPNLSLLLIDHALQPGECYNARWNQTPIRFIAKVEQSGIADLYAQMDVLVAPSIWPESYGLVTREALQAGLWVIASDRGAIGDCIIEGENGNRVDVSDCHGLQSAFGNLSQSLTNLKNKVLEEKIDHEDGEMSRRQYLDALVRVYCGVLV